MNAPFWRMVFSSIRHPPLQDWHWEGCEQPCATLLYRENPLSQLPPPWVAAPATPCEIPGGLNASRLSKRLVRGAMRRLARRPHLGRAGLLGAPDSRFSSDGGS